MAKQWSVHIEGLKELNAKLESMPDLAQVAIPEALADAAEPIRDRAASLAPVGPTGELQNSIIVEGPLVDLDFVGGALPIADDAVTVRIGPDREHWYGIFPELGTSKMPAHPFLRPAFDELSLAAVKAVGTQLWNTVRRAGI